ncbi:hypothetical protein [Pseudothermotoga sp.]|nr:hypothetical protein [Pseudothermotoga sp.]
MQIKLRRSSFLVTPFEETTLVSITLLSRSVRATLNLVPPTSIAIM